MSRIYDRVALIGIGLIGSSLARVIRRDALARHISVSARSYATLDKAKESKSEDGKAPANLWVSVSITEGKNREVRKVLESVGLTVNRLIRLAYGPFQLGQLDHADLVGIPDVHGAWVRRMKESYHPLHEVVDVADGSRLAAVARDRDRLLLEGLPLLSIPVAGLPLDTAPRAWPLAIPAVLSAAAVLLIGGRARAVRGAATRPSLLREGEEG